MSWRHIVDARGDSVRTDWPRLAVVLGATTVITGLISALTSPLVVLVVALLALPALIWLDVRLRKGNRGEG